MDTQNAISTLSALSSSMKQEALGKTAQAEAMDMALSILQGTFQSQLLVLEQKYKDTIGSLNTANAEKDSTIVTLTSRAETAETSNTDKDTQITTLAKQVADLTPAPVVELESVAPVEVVPDSVAPSI